jgi:hypothetical protein
VSFVPFVVDRLFTETDSRTTKGTKSTKDFSLSADDAFVFEFGVVAEVDQ